MTTAVSSQLSALSHSRTPLALRVVEINGDSRREEGRAEEGAPRIGGEEAGDSSDAGDDEEGREPRIAGGPEGAGGTGLQWKAPPEEEDRRHRQREEDPVAEDDRVHEVGIGARQDENDP